MEAAKTGEVIPFDFEMSAVRVVMDEQAAPWFVAKDVCSVLGISNSRDAMSALDDDEKDGVGLTDAIGRSQITSTINESGLYTLIMRSRKPAAKRFRKWVTAEVLPTIRKVGSYNLNKEQAPADMPPLSRAARVLEAERVFRSVTRLMNLTQTTKSGVLKTANEATTRITGVDVLDMLGESGFTPKPLLNNETDFAKQVGQWLGLPEQAEQNVFTGYEILNGVFGYNREDCTRAELTRLGSLMKLMEWSKTRKPDGYRYIRPKP